MTEASGVTNLSRMACVLSMQTTCCTGAQKLVTFVVQVKKNCSVLPSNDIIQIKEISRNIEISAVDVSYI